MITKTLNSLILTTFILALTNLNHAHAETEKLTIKLENDRVLAVEVVKPSNSKLPTLLFLPGVNRGLMTNDEALEKLTNEGYGIVTMNFSVQPLSVNLLEKNIKPAFLKKSFTLTELGQEVESIVVQIKKNLKISNIIPISISYSSAVSSTLQNYPLIIDVVPMTSSAAVNPELEAYRATLKASEIWNPIFGPGITRSLLDQAYYSQWNSQVDSMITTFKLNADRRAEMIEGYTVMSRAAEGFVWNEKLTPLKTRRVFLLARNDSETLLKNQLSLILKLLDMNANILAFVVNKSGHVMPVDQPTAYANIISMVTTGELKNATGIIELEPGTVNPKLLKGLDAKKYIQNLINNL